MVLTNFLKGLHFISIRIPQLQRFPDGRVPRMRNAQVAHHRARLERGQSAARPSDGYHVQPAQRPLEGQQLSAGQRRLVGTRADPCRCRSRRGEAPEKSRQRKGQEGKAGQEKKK